MDAIAFKNYLKKFEGKVIRKGVERGMFGSQRLVTIRNGRLWTGTFGKKMGLVIPTSLSLVVDYLIYII